MARRHPWRDTGIWLVGDTHVHHRQEGLERVVDMAHLHGCDFLAFAEHSFYTEHLHAQPHLLERAARAHPDMILVNGTEWSTPVGSAERTEQAGLMMPGVGEGMGVLCEFLDKYDTKVARIPHSWDTFIEALSWLGARGEGDVRPIVILTHPHRPQAAFTAAQIRRALETGPAVAGLCASSRPPQLGSLEVWPWSAEVGGTCDRLFAEGRRFVMLAESHFHKDTGEGTKEFWPGEFRRNYVFCPERAEAGLFRGLRSGASYFVLGDIVSDLDFGASAAGASIMMGESMSVPSSANVDVTVSFVQKRPLDVVELIGNPNGDIRVVASARGSELTREGGRARITAALKACNLPCFLRARGCARVEEPYPVTAWFYTNPLWLSARD